MKISITEEMKFRQKVVEYDGVTLFFTDRRVGDLTVEKMFYKCYNS